MNINMSENSKGNLKLANFVQDTVSIVQCNSPDTSTVEDISNKVRAVVDKIAKSIGSKDGRFVISEILPVGGFFEKTKIIEANEFDFLVVINELSTQGAIHVVKDNAPAGQAYIEVIDRTLLSKWWCSGNRLNQFQYAPPVTGVQNSFMAVALETVREVAKSQDVKLVMDNNCLISVSRDEKTDKEGITFPDIEDTYIHQAASGSPNFILAMLVKGLPITVDISPAIRYHDINDVYKEADSNFPMLARKVIDRGSILLLNPHDPSQMNASGDLFRITFTETEVDFIRNMNKNHKNIYIFLKYFNKCYEMPLVKRFSSYCLKLVCTQHDLECKDNSNPKACLSHIVEYLYLCSNNEYIFNPFCKSYRLQILRTELDDKKMIPALKYIVENSENLPNVSKYSLEQLELYMQNLNTPLRERLRSYCKRLVCNVM